MSSLRRHLHEQSYSVTAIRNLCILILCFGMVTAFFVGQIPKPEQDLVGRLYQLHLRMLHQKKRTPSMPQGTGNGIQDLLKDIPNSDIWLGILMGEEDLSDPQSNGVNFAMALGQIFQGNLKEAIPYLEKEHERHTTPLVRRVLLRTVYTSGDDALLERYISDPVFQEEVQGSFLFSVGMDRMDWALIFQHFWKAQYGNLRLDILFLALIAGALWTFLICSLYPNKWHLRKVWIVPVAIGLGWISTWPTVWSLIWLDTRFNLGEGNDFVSTFAYMFISVGFREELCKLLLYTPFLLYTVKRGRDTEALLLGALVGLGFAIEENMNYFYGGVGTVVIPRFTSANFLHFTLTGVTSLALTRAIRDPQKWLGDSLQVLLSAIGLHAIYNTLLSQPVPVLGEMSYFSGTALVGCGYLFFREASTLCPDKRMLLSRTSIFVWGFCLLFNLEIIQAAMLYPFDKALNFTGKAALSSVFTAYIFLHFNREALGE